MKHHYLSRLSPLLALGVMSFASAAMAQELTSQVAFQIVDADAYGNEMLVSQNTVRPGQTIQYAITHFNETEADISGMVVMAPIPNGVTFAEGTDVSSLDATFEVQAELDPSADGLEWSVLPATRIVLADDGTAVQEPLPMAEIEAVRWTLASALESGGTSLNTYRVIVD